MFYIRTTKTASGAIAVQIVRYEHRKLVVMEHLGSAHTAKEVAALKQIAIDWIQKAAKQPALFPESFRSNLIPIDKCRYLGFRYGLLHDLLSKLFVRFKFHLLRNKLMTDLVAARIAEPGSKLQSLEFLQEFLGINHKRRDLYRRLAKFDSQKSKIESQVLALAKKELNFVFSLVFYDVTTLYFESFGSDELRKPGFSKDNKPQQPQIVIGLLVNAEGFPVAYEIFEGSKFEGHTLIPVITAFKRKHRIDTLTVVADAAMISLGNIKALEASRLHYIVGARMGNLPLATIREANRRLNRINGTSWRTETAHGSLICAFSLRRYSKDKREMERQIKKAEALLKDPGTVKRAKFVKLRGAAGYELNTALVDKAELLLGIKGYYTNLTKEIDDQTVISHYHNLWRVEQSFRIAKSDLQARPVYHFKKHTIKAHILICFMALAVCKYMELKTGKSTKKLVKLLKGVTDARILNTITNEEITLRSEMKDEVKQILEQMGM